MFKQNGYIFESPKEDNRNYPREAASAPFDVDGYHWKTGFPKRKGWYMVALAAEYGNSFMGLPVEKAYYKGRYKWDRSKSSEDSLLKETTWWEDEDGCCELPKYYVEYWCEIPESDELLPCLFDW